MKFLVIGLGSMGKRRIRNLISLGYSDIIGFDSRKDRMDESKKKYGIFTVDNIQEGLSKNPDLAIISTAPNFHKFYVEKVSKQKIPFFTEVNTDIQDIKKIIELTKKYKVLGISSMTMKFHPAIKQIKKIFESKKLGKLQLLTYHSGENLEDWHPWEQVQDYYVGHIKTGGGRDQAVFEIEWIIWLFGKPIEISAKTLKISNTKAKIFDTYQMNLKLLGVPMANVLVDVIQRPPNRILRLVFENGMISWDWIDGKVRVYYTKTKKWDELLHGEGYKGFNVEEMYQEEIKYVIKSIKDKKNYVSSFELELSAAKSVILAEKSSKMKKTMKI
jgi:predicted dehydrogenase